MLQKTSQQNKGWGYSPIVEHLSQHTQGNGFQSQFTKEVNETNDLKFPFLKGQEKGTETFIQTFVYITVSHKTSVTTHLL